MHIPAKPRARRPMASKTTLISIAAKVLTEIKEVTLFSEKNNQMSYFKGGKIQ
jgi:hypothetical protein